MTSNTTSNISDAPTLSASEAPDAHKSGDTSPTKTHTTSTGHVRASSEATLVSSVTDDARSVSTAGPPNVPYNSPLGGSIASDGGVEYGAVLDRIITIKVDDGHAWAGGNDSSNVSEAGGEKREGVKESTMWANEAIQAAEIGLKRLAQLARDEHAADRSKSVEEYFSEHLGKLIKEAELEFNAEALV